MWLDPRAPNSGRNNFEDSFIRFCERDRLPCQMDDEGCQVSQPTSLSCPCRRQISHQPLAWILVLLTFSFEINATNWEALTVLSDKYQIPSLHKDIRVHLPQSYINLNFLPEVADRESFTMKQVLEKHPCSLENWFFAARHGFLELERYQRNDVATWNLIQFVLTQRDGLGFLLNQRISSRCFGGAEL